jgi:hypothetical protein
VQVAVGHRSHHRVVGEVVDEHCYNQSMVEVVGGHRFHRHVVVTPQSDQVQATALDIVR